MIKKQFKGGAGSFSQLDVSSNTYKNYTSELTLRAC